MGFVIERLLKKKKELGKFQLKVLHSGKQARLGREGDNTLVEFTWEGHPRGRVQRQVGSLIENGTWPLEEKQDFPIDGHRL